MLVASLFASFVALSTVSAMPSMIVGRDNQPPCVPNLSADAYNIFTAGNDSFGMQYIPGSPASVYIHDMGFNTKDTDVTWLVSTVNQSNTISPNYGQDPSLCLVNTDNTLSNGDCSTPAAQISIGCQTCSNHFATGCYFISQGACVTTNSDETPLPFDACDSPLSRTQLYDFSLA